MLPPRFSCDADTGSQGPRSSAQSGRPCGLPWHLPRADLQPSFLKGSGVFLPGPWEQGAPACLNHRNKPITASWGPGAAPRFLPQSCPLRRMQRTSDLWGLARPLPGAPTSSSWVPSPEPPPHLPGRPQCAQGGPPSAHHGVEAMLTAGAGGECIRSLGRTDTRLYIK